MEGSGGLLKYDHNSPLALQNVGMQFLDAMIDDADTSDRMTPLKDVDGDAAPQCDGRASFGLSQGLLVPGVKHLMHNTQDDMLKGLRHYAWFVDLWMNIICVCVSKQRIVGLSFPSQTFQIIVF